MLSITMSENLKVDTIFTAKAIKSRNSYMLWIPKREAELLSLKEKSFIRVGLKKLKNPKNK